MNEIKLKQAPIISHELIKAGQAVTNRLAALNLDKQVATPDTVKSLKELRAELNKEFGNYEAQRKALDKALNAPMVEFKALYKTEIADKYSEAKETLNKGIVSVETKMKEDKRNNITTYFKELCQSEEIDFLTFENVGIEINLSTSEKKYKEQCNDFVSRIKDDLALIETQEFKVEILVDYKQTLNATKAIKTIQDRKANEAAETERVKQKEYLRRSKALLNIGTTADKETKSYIYNDEIYVSWDSVKDIKLSEFNCKIIELEEKIKSDKAEKQKLINAEKQKEEPVKTAEVVKEPVIVKAPEVIKPPEVVEQKEGLETVQARFEVSGTMPELMKLKQFLIENNYTYKNLNNE